MWVNVVLWTTMFRSQRILFLWFFEPQLFIEIRSSQVQTCCMRRETNNQEGKPGTIVVMKFLDGRNFYACFHMNHISERTLTSYFEFTETIIFDETVATCRRGSGTSSLAMRMSVFSLIQKNVSKDWEKWITKSKLNTRSKNHCVFPLKKKTMHCHCKNKQYQYSTISSSHCDNLPHMPL